MRPTRWSGARDRLRRAAGRLGRGEWSSRARSGTVREVDSAAGRGPTVAYAGILDGRALWLALDGIEESASVGLYGEPGYWQVPREQVEWVYGDSGDPRWSVRVPLGDLPGDAPATFELRVVHGGAATPPPVAGALAPSAPTRTPVPVEGPWEFAVSPSSAGTLELARIAARPRTPVDQLGAAPDHLWVRYRGVQDEGHLQVLDAADRLVARLPSRPDGDRVRGVVSAEALPSQGRWRLVTGPEMHTEKDTAAATEADWRPLTRAWHDLRQPTRSVTLPALHLGSGTALRFSWDPDGWLCVVLEDTEQQR